MFDTILINYSVNAVSVYKHSKTVKVFRYTIAHSYRQQHNKHTFSHP